MKRQPAAMMIACALVGAAGHARALTPLATTISWTDSTGEEGFVTFEGVADGSTLKGLVRAGDDKLKAEGTIASDGTVTGTLTDWNGGSIGTFGGTFVDGELQGGYFVRNGTGGGWTAPSDESLTQEVSAPPTP